MHPNPNLPFHRMHPNPDRPFHRMQCPNLQYRTPKLSKWRRTVRKSQISTMADPSPKKRKRQVIDKADMKAGKFMKMTYNYVRYLGSLRITLQRPDCQRPDLDVQWSKDQVSDQAQKPTRGFLNSLFHMLSDNDIADFERDVIHLKLSKFIHFAKTKT
jgi:hypothetical protein